MGYKPEVLNPRPFPAVKFGLQVRYILDFNIFQKYSIHKHIYPSEGLCRAEPERGPIVFTLHFIGVGRGTGGFNLSPGNPPF